MLGTFKSNVHDVIAYATKIVNEMQSRSQLLLLSFESHHQRPVKIAPEKYLQENIYFLHMILVFFFLNIICKSNLVSFSTNIG